ncbi:HPP family protein [Paraconexibacter sp.]|uniref:CBS domain-containing protein n=1 Tax=Paraconexibacter sp. TaxID=2949640 RepID=UPI00356354CD
MPRSIIETTMRQAPTVTRDQPVVDALRVLVDTGLPAVPVVDQDGRLRGIFGEREFIGALFPGYLSEIGYAGFVTHSLDDTIDRRAGCLVDPVGKHLTTEHVDVSTDAADAAVAEVFLHHRVLLVPITDHGRVVGVVTRADFFRAVAERTLARGDGEQE